MATPKRQRIAIFIIMIVMVLGTLGSFVVIILQNDNQKLESKKQQAEMAKYQKAMEEYQKKQAAQAKELSDKHYPAFSVFSNQPAKFDKDSVKELATEDLTVGQGAVIDDKSSLAAYYIGWNPDGKVFDQSIDGDKLKSPLPIEELGKAELIEGWKKGMKDMKIGGIRLITIPSDLAYKEQGRGDDIPPNTPLKFIVMATEKPADLTPAGF